MARTYKRDARGRFASGGGGGGGKKASGGGKGTVAQRKAEMNKTVTSAALFGKGQRNRQQERYIGAQNRSAAAATATRGKGSKAARRAAGAMERSAIAAQRAKFSGKSAKNNSARAKYKAAAGKARDLAKTAAKVAANPKASAKTKAFWSKSAGAAKGGLTRITNNLSGKSTRGKKALAAAQQTGRIRQGARSGVIKPGARKAKSQTDGTMPDTAIKGSRSPRGQGGPRGKTGKKVDVQLRRAKPGGEYGPDGHWYPGGSFINPGRYVGGKSSSGAGQMPASTKSKESGNGSVAQVRRNRNPPPRPLTPPGRGLDAQKGMNKTAQKLNQDFFSSSGYLSAGLERAFRQAGSNGRAPIDNTRYLGALASRLSEKDLRSRTAATLRRLDKQQRRYYIQDIQDARRNMGMTRFGVPKTGVSDRQLLNAIRFDNAARYLAGQRAMRRRRGARNVSEEYAWVTNAMLSASRRR